MPKSPAPNIAFSRAETESITGATAVDLQNWTERGWIGNRQLWGKGHKRKYRLADLLSAAVLKSLARLGVPPSIAGQVADEIQKRGVALFLGQRLKAAGAPMEPAQLRYWFISRHGDDWHWSEVTADEAHQLGADTSDLPEAFIVLQLDTILHRVISAAEAIRPFLKRGLPVRSSS